MAMAQTTITVNFQTTGLPTAPSQPAGKVSKSRPTIVPKKPFDPASEAHVLRSAMKGIGTDERSIINVLSTCTNKQRLEVASQFKSIFGKDLMKDLKSETSFKFKDLVVAAMTPLPQFYAQELHRAIDGLGTNESILREVLGTLDSDMMKKVSSEYQKLYQTTLERDIRGDTSLYFKKLLVALSQARREDKSADETAAAIDARTLYRAGAERIGTDESTFISVLTTRSFAHIRQIGIEYEKIYGKSLERAIKSEFSGDIKKGLLTIVKYSRNPDEYFARRFYKSMAGLGTNDSMLIRLVVTRAEIDLEDIKDAFQKKYQKSLGSFIEGDTSGHYKKLLFAMCGSYY